MTNVEFLKNWNRICEEAWDCDRCLLDDHCTTLGPAEWEDGDLSKIVSIVEKWAAEHPVKTRLAEYKKLFPNLHTKPNGFPIADPCEIERGWAALCCSSMTCDQCREKFWNEEIE